MRWLRRIDLIDIMTVGGIALVALALADMRGWAAGALVTGVCLLGLGLYGARTPPAPKG